jgi:hypothetical protein
MLMKYVFALMAGLLSITLLSMNSYAASDPTPTPYSEPQGCLAPPEDYTRLWVNGVQLNGRTLAMLDYAQSLYGARGGVLDFRLGLTQGSYNAGVVAASFGTHDGGGAVDLSVRNPVDWAVMTDQIDLMIWALRLAGFAAWLRDTNELYPNSPIHIHAIAIGDMEASPEARAQMDGTFGYLRGFNGLPQINGIPLPDPYGGPVICNWMIERGFGDLRGRPVPRPTLGGTARPAQSIP